MEFGVFVGMYHPKHRRQARRDRAGRAARRARRRAGGRPVRVQVRVGHRAPLPRRVLAPLGQRGVDGLRAGHHRQHPHRVGDHQHHAAGLSPRAGGREGGDARPARARVASSSAPVAARRRPRCSASASTRWTRRATCSTRRCPEIIKMMGPEEYGPYEGQFFSLPRRQVLPKPVTLPHPPIWVAAGSPGTFEKAARMGIGVLCFSFAGAEALKPLIDIYKTTIEDADPVGGYVNNNVMVTTAMMTLEDGDRAREVFRHNQTGYHTSLVAKYLDSFPQAAGIDKTPTLDATDPARAGEQGDRDGRHRGGDAGRGDQHDARSTRRSAPTRCRSGRCPTTRRSTPPSSRWRRSASSCSRSSTRTRCTRPRVSAKRSSVAGHSGGRFSRNAAMPSWASASAALAAITGCTTLVGVGFGALDLVVERPLAEPDHARAEAQDLLRSSGRSRRRAPLGGHDLVHEAPVERGRGVDRFPGEEHLQRPLAADRAGQRHHRRRAEEADAHAGRGEGGGVGRDREVTRGDELTARRRSRRRARGR